MAWRNRPIWFGPKPDITRVASGKVAMKRMLDEVEISPLPTPRNPYFMRVSETEWQKRDQKWHEKDQKYHFSRKSKNAGNPITTRISDVFCGRTFVCPKGFEGLIDSKKPLNHAGFSGLESDTLILFEGEYQTEIRIA